MERTGAGGWGQQPSSSDRDVVKCLGWLPRFYLPSQYGSRYGRYVVLPAYDQPRAPNLLCTHYRCKLFAICWGLGISCTLRDFTNLP